ncbi:MAG: V-type ATP synthase subunit D [Kiritimatiellae bacterium]|nr:V-type ATP synthase subunit D [Kiritimatiellia bacterium]
MAKIKNTKTELKAQTDALNRYERFLPMLQLKKQQLQAEIASLTAEIAGVEAEERRWRESLRPWLGLFATAELPEGLVALKGVRTSTGNIAGVPIPVYEGVDTERAEIDLFETPAWFDDAAGALENAFTFIARRDVLSRQRDLISEELRSTSQRVNLFEKVKIPECRENIRVIRIHIGDESTAAVARGKIAKKRGAAAPEELEASA